MSYTPQIVCYEPIFSILSAKLLKLRLKICFICFIFSSYIKRIKQLLFWAINPQWIQFFRAPWYHPRSSPNEHFVTHEIQSWGEGAWFDHWGLYCILFIRVIMQALWLQYSIQNMKVLLSWAIDMNIFHSFCESLYNRQYKQGVHFFL